jgi:uncharacterized membrane protein
MVDEGAEKRRRIYRLINGGLLTCIILMGVSTWNRLPQSIPIHFGADGLPNRWTNDRSELVLLFLIPFLLTGLMYASGLLVPWFRQHPQWVNIPNKKRFLELPVEQQMRFWSCLREFFPSMAVAANLLLLSAIRGTLEVALGKIDRLPWWSVWPGLAVLIIVAIIQTVRIFTITGRIRHE